METPGRKREEATDDEPADDVGDDQADGTEAPESRGAGTVALDDGRRLSLPADASDEEAAALAVAVATHLDREREDATGAEPEPELDRWKMAARLGARSRDALPRSRPGGGAWKAASRCR